jgi:phospholipid/cholesterol/gamma-HCH transport system permease protein
MGKKIEKQYFEIIKEGTRIEVIFLTPFTIENLHGFDQLKPFGKHFDGATTIRLNFTKVEKFDSAFVVFVVDFQNWAKTNNIGFELISLPENAKELLENLADSLLPFKAPTTDENPFFAYFKNVGEKVLSMLNDVVLFIEFFGGVLIELFGSLFHPRKIRWADFPQLFIQSGVNAVPIVSLILLLVGIISGYQGAIQLKQFGADIYIADLIGVSITRELGPLMTAILVAGRSGSAFTAVIGTMKVAEEIDALRVMGFSPMRFLVIPRVYAVSLSIPFLVMIGNLAGIVGGLISGLATLDITSIGYFIQLQKAVSLGDIASGLAKSVIFGFLIASIGCYRGLKVQGGAENVGHYTTLSVVNGIFAIIIADTIFTFIFDAIGL